jgi:CMP-N,N'-diacetyllegionaminic acid synthase
MNIVAIIPARGGSKGIPKKNLVDINNHPLIWYSIKHALQCNLINKVIVSTDSEEIAEIALEGGAEVPFLRPKELAEDHVLDHPVYEHAIDFLLSEQGYKADIVVHLRPTAPFRRIGWLDESIKLLIENKSAHSVRSVSAVRQHPYRMFEITEDGFLDPLMKDKHPEPYLLRRQDLPDLYYYNCVIDVTRYSTIKELRSMTGSKILSYIIDDEEVVDVDTPLDLEIVRNVFKDKL